MTRIPRFDVDGETPQEAICGAFVRWQDVEVLQQELRDMKALALAAIQLVPDETTLGELSGLREEARQVLMGSDKQRLARQAEEITRLQTALEHSERPPGPTLHSVKGLKNNGFVYHLPVIRAERHLQNGGLIIEVVLP